METDDEITEDEEEILVYVEFDGLDGNVFNENQLQLDMIGIDTEHPTMQINGKFYEGTYEDVVGTYMLFARNDNTTINDPVFDVAPNYKYFAKTRKVLKMQRIFVKPRTEVLGDSDHSQCVPNLQTLKDAGVPFCYQEKALSFWRTVRNNRLNALHSYLEKQRIRQQKKSEGITLDSESDEDNPFAIYKHKEVSTKTCKTDKSGQNNDQTDSNFLSDQMVNDIQETSNSRELNCQNNYEKLVESWDSECISTKGDNDNDDSLLKPAKGNKTKISRKKKLGVPCSRQRVQIRTKRTVKNNILSLGMDEEELSGMKKQ